MKSTSDFQCFSNLQSRNIKDEDFLINSVRLKKISNGFKPRFKYSDNVMLNVILSYFWTNIPETSLLKKLGEQAKK